MPKDDDDFNEENEEYVIQEEYKVWKKNCPYLYDLCVSRAFEWPSLTVEWFPEKEVLDNGVFRQKLLLGTHTSNDEQNYVLIAEILLPVQDSEMQITTDTEIDETSGFGSSPGRFRPVQQISHDGEVNRARYMPQNSFLIATKTIHAEVYIFNYSRHASRPDPAAPCRPDLRLLGHDAEGYGLAWSPFHDGQLLSGSDDKKICLWNISANTSSENCMEALSVYQSHEGVVEDVAWHMKHPNLFASGGDDHLLCLWDTRTPALNGPFAKCESHRSEINSVSFNPFNEWLLATGATDRLVVLHDMRYLQKQLHVLEKHEQDVFAVKWSPTDEAILASCGADRRILIWDLSKIGQSQSAEEAKEGPPELLFVHGGHISKVSDFAWNLNDDWVLASVAEDNVVQVWQMSDKIYTAPPRRGP
eukprot:g5629.t1